jgi:hypothetical protein
VITCCSFILKMEAAVSSEMLVSIYKSTQCYVPEVSDLLNHLIC